ncbi:SRPBCC family protein [Streptomyces sp. TRM72054]|uniref:SRPBCC family protein n=1 Tax=Streptomyces sp. TRM72054 TaxID=2870562 RepID=UPI001C8CDD44|nr:SRPBCC family protein [Streptomyces sp. TRM72054]MBX9392515.1 SRPBCC family protein [Streptomyces sp. TRM72054]
MIDVTHQINSVSRQVGKRVFKAGEARVVTVSQTYDASLDDVWDACTNAERLPRWFAPVTGELRLGGRYQVQGNASGTIERCDPPKGFFATWEFGGDVSWIELRLTPDGDERTRFELEHIAHVDDERWAQFGPGAVGVGWDLAVMGLATHLSSGASVDPAEAEAWATSEEGIRFITLSSEGWYAASVASGKAEPPAREAADRTTAFYTGAGEQGTGE